MRRQIKIKRFEITEGAFRLDEPQLHQGAGRIINEDEQSAGRPTILEPTVIRAVDLNEFTQPFPAQAWLMEVRRCLRLSQRPASIFAVSHAKL